MSAVYLFDHLNSPLLLKIMIVISLNGLRQFFIRFFFFSGEQKCFMVIDGKNLTYPENCRVLT